MSYSSPSRSSGKPSSGSNPPVPTPRAPPSYQSIRQEVIRESAAAAAAGTSAKQDIMSNNASSSSQQSNSLLETLLTGGPGNDTLNKLAMLAYVTNPDKGQAVMQGLLTAQVPTTTLSCAVFEWGLLLEHL